LVRKRVGKSGQEHSQGITAHIRARSEDDVVGASGGRPRNFNALALVALGKSVAGKTRRKGAVATHLYDLGRVNCESGGNATNGSSSKESD
jgi:hypothetical protein